jgi:deazaflavin-dependent oxidoreductase (nitroreductase family)
MTVQDSPVGWVKEHIDRYVATGGEEGHEWRPGVFTLLLTTTGRKSGEQRSSVAAYLRHGDAYSIVASNAGSNRPPAWWLNLQADPHAQVTLRGERFAVVAEQVGDQEHAAVWARFVAAWPGFADYQAGVRRRIAVVRLRRSEVGGRRAR